MATVNPSVALATAEASAVASFISTSATMQILSGTIPATPETAATGTLLVTIPLASFSASGAVVTSSDPSAVSPAASGTASWARILKSDGTTVVADLDVTATGGGGSVQLGTTTITTGTTVDLSAVTITIPSV
ncbi:hypothetical protein [Gryllotalpicola koreensis]|uniref:DUF2190 family protein n=1 Tax=Gryllotalpicola koreensis TaxID=993086 RepID=A0ABP8A208_9MICO